MTKTLYILRHTKAAQPTPNEAMKDHDRRLTPRGRQAAKRLGNYFAAQVMPVDRVYCSTSRRTRETYELIRSSLDNPAVSFRSSLYLMSSDDMLPFIQAIPDAIKSAMIIGHNPGLHDAVLSLIGRAGRGQAKKLESLRNKFPTGGFCALSFDAGSWKKVGTGLATLTSFVRPRDLAET